MQTQVEAIYEKGVFRPLQPIELAENQRVLVSIDAIPTELLDMANVTHFQLPPERWQAFCEALDAPAKDIPALRRLFQQTNSFEDNGPATH
jgi:predicted DNA-binding antitoxin AbrB/MazE fold protein